MDRLVFIMNSLTVGGVEKIIAVLLNQLSELGIEVEFICLEHNDFSMEKIVVEYKKVLNV